MSPKRRLEDGSSSSSSSSSGDTQCYVKLIGTPGKVLDVDVT